MMKTITKQELKEVLDKHKKWLNYEQGGKRANFSDDEDLSYADFSGSDVRYVDFSGSNLRFADFSNANLSYASLSDVYLSNANFTGATFTGTIFGDDVPIIQDIHKKVYEAASPKGSLSMNSWHKCGTTHCWAGWVVHLAGDEGYDLESRLGPACAAAAIYEASDPGFIGRETVPDFFASKEAALIDMKRLAEA